ncbi:OmpA family protein [uncultured Flavobacterium sp.]|uniref:OmpA family protein n=1 Tax=uncultured Flavobacterium sp. TaxID=165435 RepID=UPI0030CA5AA7
MIKKLALATLVVTLTSSCVSKKIYSDLENKFADVKKERNNLSDENRALTTDKNNLDLQVKGLQSKLDSTKSERDKLANDYAASKKNYDNLKASYDALEKDSNKALAENIQKNRALIAELEAKQKSLNAEQERLNQLKAELEFSSKRLNELEEMIAAKDAGMKALKDNLSKALNAFEGKGLTVEQRNGKVYVSMENKLLFESGSWTVGVEGKKAVAALGKVLAENPEISVLIEGHTDDDKISGNIDGVQSNWDLSTKRATAIVNILEVNKTIDKKNLTAAGRGEFAPIASNENPDGKAKNRRIEIILTPKLDEIGKLLNEL